MSNYQNPPADPYGASPQDQSGQQPANPYGQPAYGQPAAGVPQGVTFAHWGKRVVATLIDTVLGTLAQFLYVVGAIMAASSAEVTTDPVTGQVTSTTGGSGLALALMAVGALMGLAFYIWNYLIKQGKTGYTIGKGIMGIKLVKAETGQPIGAGMCFVRQLAHFLDALPCGVGYLWPLWDAKRQTFADKVIGTYVIDQPKG